MVLFSGSTDPGRCAPRGQRVIGSVPHNYGKRLTVLAALDRHGIRAAMTVEGATDGPLFLTFRAGGLRH